MTFEEKLEKAMTMRRRDLFGQPSSEELATIEADQQEIFIPLSDGGRLKIYQITPLKEKNDMLVINFHGGGFIKGRQEKDRLFCSRLCRHFGCTVWDTDYSLAPEHPFPTAVNESFEAVKYAMENSRQYGLSAEKIILMGHSAGGNLATSVCINLSDHGMKMPAALICEYMVTDLFTDPADKKRSPQDMPAETARAYNAFYCRPSMAKDPLISPIFARDKTLSAFPPSLIITAGLDSLDREGEEFALKLARAGVPVTLQRFCESRHGFTINREGQGEQATELIFKFIKNIEVSL